MLKNVKTTLCCRHLFKKKYAVLWNPEKIIFDRFLVIWKLIIPECNPPTAVAVVALAPLPELG